MKIVEISIGADADFSPQNLAKICVFALIICKLFLFIGVLRIVDIQVDNPSHSPRAPSNRPYRKFSIEVARPGQAFEKAKITP